MWLPFTQSQEMTEQGIPLLILFYHPDRTEVKELFRSKVADELKSHRGWTCTIQRWARVLYYTTLFTLGSTTLSLISCTNTCISQCHALEVCLCACHVPCTCTCTCTCTLLLQGMICHMYMYMHNNCRMSCKCIHMYTHVHVSVSSDHVCNVVTHDSIYVQAPSRQ